MANPSPWFSFSKCFKQHDGRRVEFEVNASEDVNAEYVIAAYGNDDEYEALNASHSVMVNREDFLAMLKLAQVDDPEAAP